MQQNNPEDRNLNFHYHGPQTPYFKIYTHRTYHTDVCYSQYYNQSAKYFDHTFLKEDSQWLTIYFNTCIQAKQDKTHHISINNADIYINPFTPTFLQALTHPPNQIFLSYCFKDFWMEQDRQCTYTTTLWRIHITILQWKHNTFCVHCYWVTHHCQLYKNIEFCTTLLLW